MIERYTGHHKYAGKGIVTNTVTGHHYSTDPIPLKKAEAQLRLLQQIEKSKEKRKP